MAINGTNGTSSLKGKTQKAAQYDSRDNKVHINEIPIPKPGPGKLLVKIVAASLCHSDVMLFVPNDQGMF